MWFTPPKSDKSASFTLAICASALSAALLIGSTFFNVAHPVTATDLAPYVTIFVGLYGWRHGRRKEGEK